MANARNFVIDDSIWFFRTVYLSLALNHGANKRKHSVSGLSLLSCLTGKTLNVFHV
jgi:hypothetical protein